jgi:hypothetical protein
VNLWQKIQAELRGIKPKRIKVSSKRMVANLLKGLLQKISALFK